jgi:hypothetical protein
MRKYKLTTKITKDTKGSDNLNSELRALRVLRGENFLSILAAALPRKRFVREGNMKAT